MKPATAGGARAPLRQRLAAPLAALLLCAGTQLAFDTAFAAQRGDLGPLGYPLLVVGLTLALAAAVAGIVAAARAGVETALLCWVLIEAALHLDFAFGERLLLAACLVGSAALAARVASSGAAARPGLGFSTGVALCAGFIAAPPLSRRVEAHLALGALPAWVPVALAFATVALSLAWLSRRGWRVARVPIAHAIGAGGLLAALLGGAPQSDAGSFPAAPAGGAGPNILLLVLDTVRADHLSLYGYERATTPELERRLGRGKRTAVFPYAFATSNWTIPSHVSLFTGLLPSEHQVHAGNGVGRDATRRWVVDLPETLAERLAGAGYRTAGVIANPFLMHVDGAGRGFDLWALAERPRALQFVGEWLRRWLVPRAYRTQLFPIPTATAVNRRVLHLLDGCGGGGCFVVANYMEAHAPYWANAPRAGRFTREAWNDVPDPLLMKHSAADAELAARAYDEAILELDAQLGCLLRRLDERGLGERMWLFITSDHGEAFREHASVGHVTSLYNEQVRVPLIVRPPAGVELRSSEQPTSLLDVTATISAIATGTPLGRGRDLRAGSPADAPAQMEFFGWRDPQHRYGLYTELPARAAVRGEWKLLELDGRLELYHLRSDPTDRENRASSFPEEVEALARELPPLEIRRGRVREHEQAIPPEELEALRAIGYVD